MLAFSIVSIHEVEMFVGDTNPNFSLTESSDPAAIVPTLEVTATVPEPGVTAGLLAGLCALSGLARRRGRKA